MKIKTLTSIKMNKGHQIRFYKAPNIFNMKFSTPLNFYISPEIEIAEKFLLWQDF